MSRPTVEALITKAAARVAPDLPAKAKADLSKIMAHNDSVGRAQRVPAEDAVKLLADKYNLRMARAKFDRVIKAAFGRTWGNT